MRLAAVALVLLAGITPHPVPAQSHAGDLVRAGRDELAAHHLEAADSLLRAALDSGSGLEDIDRQGAYVWLGITEYYRGNDSLTQVAFRSALLLNIELQVEGLAKLDPHLAELFEQERVAVHNAQLTLLITQARSLVAAQRPDSALALLRFVLDSSVHLTESQRVHALLVRGMAWKAAGKDSLGSADIAAGLAGYRDLTARGMALEPYLTHLADSLAHPQRSRHP